MECFNVLIIGYVLHAGGERTVMNKIPSRQFCWTIVLRDGFWKIISRTIDLWSNPTLMVFLFKYLCLRNKFSFLWMVLNILAINFNLAYCHFFCLPRFFIPNLIKWLWCCKELGALSMTDWPVFIFDWLPKDLDFVFSSNGKRWKVALV